jgi:hypothetical protein
VNGTLVFDEDGSFTYTPNPGFVGTDTFTYTTDNGRWSRDPASPDFNTVDMNSVVSNVATVTIEVMPPPSPAIDGFENVDNLPPAPKKTFKRGGVVPFKWQWLTDLVPVDTSHAEPEFIARVCSVRGLTTGEIVADAQYPGNSSFQAPTAGNNWTWAFNWELTYVSGGKKLELPAGTYVVLVVSDVIGRADPGADNDCNGMNLKGARVEVGR